jgi:hypothetical protein
MNKKIASVIGLALTLQAATAVDFPPPLDFSHPQMPYLNWNPGLAYDESVRMFEGIPSIVLIQSLRLDTMG